MERIQAWYPHRLCDAERFIFGSSSLRQASTETEMIDAVNE
jgi:hypothetical protein